MFQVHYQPKSSKKSISFTFVEAPHTSICPQSRSCGYIIHRNHRYITQCDKRNDVTTFKQLSFHLFHLYQLVVLLSVSNDYIEQYVLNASSVLASQVGPSMVLPNEHYFISTICLNTIHHKTGTCIMPSS